jgi:predicted Zn finger-like uncharacterized protein
MFDRRNSATGSDVERSVPTSCPSCQSSAIATSAKNPDAGSYWRCNSCGEVWNDSRLTRDRRPQWR